MRRQFEGVIRIAKSTIDARVQLDDREMLTLLQALPKGWELNEYLKNFLHKIAAGELKFPDLERAPAQGIVMTEIRRLQKKGRKHKAHKHKTKRKKVIKKHKKS